MLAESAIVELLKHAHLFKEAVQDKQWTYSFPKPDSATGLTTISYNSKQSDAHTLFFCKGRNFKRAYLDEAIRAGVPVIVTENVFSETPASVVQLIVTDIKKAMAVVARAFYGYPDKEFKRLIGFTGTKGKTTAVYFTRHILQHMAPGKVAQFSSVENSVDGVHYTESGLTTMESVDLFRSMRQAVDNGMEYLVMEVSSQAYKTNRVYGITFDIGVFLNISPDHISPVEHPSFDDYLYCKTQLFKNSRTMVINAETDYASLLLAKVRAKCPQVITYGKHQGDYRYGNDQSDGQDFSLVNASADVPAVDEQYRMKMVGAFNHENAVPAIIVSRLCGADVPATVAGIAETTISGRMEMLQAKDGLTVCVDYAHNYISLKRALQYLRQTHPHGQVVVVVGGVGGKAESRRADIGRAVSEEADVAYITEDDSANVDPREIMQAIVVHITPNVTVHQIVDRKQAVTAAINGAHPDDVVLLAAKGRERFIYKNGEHVPYDGDYYLAQELLKHRN